MATNDTAKSTLDLAMAAKKTIFQAQDEAAKIVGAVRRRKVEGRLARVRAELEALDRELSRSPIEDCPHCGAFSKRCEEDRTDGRACAVTDEGVPE